MLKSVVAVVTLSALLTCAVHNGHVSRTMTQSRREMSHSVSPLTEASRIGDVVFVSDVMTTSGNATDPHLGITHAYVVRLDRIVEKMSISGREQERTWKMTSGNPPFFDSAVYYAPDAQVQGYKLPLEALNRAPCTDITKLSPRLQRSSRAYQDFASRKLLLIGSGM